MDGKYLRSVNKMIVFESICSRIVPRKLRLLVNLGKVQVRHSIKLPSYIFRCESLMEAVDNDGREVVKAEGASTVRN